MFNIILIFKKAISTEQCVLTMQFQALVRLYSFIFSPCATTWLVLWKFALVQYNVKQDSNCDIWEK